MDNMGYEHMTGGVLQEYQYPQAFELESPSEGTHRLKVTYGQCGQFPQEFQHNVNNLKWLKG